MGKNLQRVQSMIDGTYQNKIQVGYQTKSISEREEGEKWEENGKDWEKVDGKRKQITKIPRRGFDTCNDCSKLILNNRDQDTFNRMSKCFHCQLNFEVNLKAKGEWKEWALEQEKKRFESIEKEMVQLLKEMAEQGISFYNSETA